MIRRLRKARGFTLVELMIVVAIIGILAALAIYGVKKYLTNAKTAEAKNNLGRLGKDAVSAFERETMNYSLAGAGAETAAVHRLCATALNPVPKAKGTGGVPKGSKIQPDPSDWTGDSVTGWKCLRFSVDSPVYYQYNYTSTNPTDPTQAAFSSTATGDLNGDGSNFSVWTYEGGIVKGSNGDLAMRLATTIQEPANPDE